MLNKAITKRGVRVTSNGKQTGKRGRPKGTRKKRLFEETKLGFFLKYEAPIEYDLIMGSTPNSVFPEPKIKIIEAITISSPNQVFQKNKFFRYLEEYRKNTIYSDRARVITPVKEKYYKTIQDNQMKKYMASKKKNGTYY